MPITYDIKKDYLYNKGIEKGIKKGIEKGVEIPVVNAYKKGYDAEQIESIMDLPLKKVKDIINNFLKTQE